MSTQSFERAAAVFRSVLAAVRVDQLDDPTPCVPFTVAELVSKAIGHQNFLRAALHGARDDATAPSRPQVLVPAPRLPADYAGLDPGAFSRDFDRSSAAMVGELRADGAMTRTVALSASQSFSGAEMMILATRNIFQYAWDLASATGQSTDLEPELATELLSQSKTIVVPLRGAGGFFGPEFVPPAGSPVADVLAGFLGRTF